MIARALHANALTIATKDGGCIVLSFQGEEIGSLEVSKRELELRAKTNRQTVGFCSRPLGRENPCISPAAPRIQSKEIFRR
jgi:hypothetical protein